jgi:hypothetical protein
MINTRFTAPGNSYTLTAGDPGYSGAFGGGAWSEWKMQDGSTATPWRTCSAEFLGAVSTTRVIILPICLLVAVLLSLVLVWKTAGLNPLMVAVPAVLLILCCIFLFFSLFWPTAIVIALAALFAMGAGHKGGTAFLVAMAIEMFALAVVCGGLGLGAFVYSNTTPNLWFGIGGAAGAHSYTWSALSTCSAYYDYFVIDATNRAYDQDPNVLYTNYCSEGWYAYIGLVADFVVSLQIFMLVATGVAYLRGPGSGTSKSA